MRSQQHDMFDDKPRTTIACPLDALQEFEFSYSRPAAPGYPALQAREVLLAESASSAATCAQSILQAARVPFGEAYLQAYAIDLVSCQNRQSLRHLLDIQYLVPQGHAD